MRSIPLLMLFLTACTIAGKLMLAEAAPAHRERAAAETLSTQLLGGTRAVPIIALWTRINAAEHEGRWFEQMTLFDLVSELAPNNAAIPYYQARTEALSVAPQQPTRQAAWGWVERALYRLTSRRERLGGAALLEEGVWDVAFYAGERFPLQVALVIAADQDKPEFERELLEAQRILQPMGAVQTFLESIGLGFAFDEREEYLTLSHDDKQALLFAQRLRWRALSMAAERGLALHRGQSSDLVFKFLISLRRYGALSTEKEAAALRAVASQNLDDEVERLRALGEERRAREFYEQMRFLIGDWMDGKIS